MGRFGSGLGCAGLAVACEVAAPAIGAGYPAAGTTGGTGTTTRIVAASSSGSDEAGDETSPPPDLPAICGAYLDEAERPMEIRITNRTDADVYLFDVDGCQQIVSIWQLHVGELGRWPIGCGALASCELLLGQSCVSGWCNLACYSIGGIRLLPGATYSESFEGLVKHETTLPPECTDGCEETSCRQARRLHPDDPTDVLLVSAPPTPRCAGGGPCSCDPGPDGWCRTPSLDPHAEHEVLLVPATVTRDAVLVDLVP